MADMDLTMLAAAVIVIGTLAAMTSGRVPAVLALATGLAVAGLLRIATPAELASGLSNAGVITVGAMLVIARGIVGTGVVSRLTWRLLASTRDAQQVLRRLIGPIGVVSGLMNTTPIVAMLIPATHELEQTRRIPARQVLLPIAHVTTLAGSVTLIGTSSNLLIAGIAVSAGVEMGMLSFAPVALPVALAGWLVIYLLAPRRLAGGVVSKASPREWRVEVPVASNALIRGRTASQLGLAETPDAKLIAIERRAGTPGLDAAIEPGDVLVFAATQTGVTDLWRSPHFGLSPQRLYEVALRGESSVTLHDIERDDLRVVAALTTRPLRESTLTPGETCFVTAPDKDAIEASDWVGLWQRATSRAPQPAKTWLALAILAGVILSASFGLAAIELAAFTGAVLMVLTGVLTPGSAARALDWNVLAILAGSVGLGAVVVSSGLAEVIASGVRTLAGGEPFLVAAVIVVVTTVLTTIVTNAATASIMTPIGIGIASEVGLDPVMVLALVGTCISFTFLNPYSHQSNLMVMRPGGYTTRDFVRFGIPLLAVVVLVATLVAWPLMQV